MTNESYTLVSVAEVEPAGFDPATAADHATISLNFGLGIENADGTADAEWAAKETTARLRAIEHAVIIIETAPNNWEIADEFSLILKTLPTPLALGWLVDGIAGALGEKPTAERLGWPHPQPDGSDADVTRSKDERHLGHVLLSMSTWTAPLPQQTGCARSAGVVFTDPTRWRSAQKRQLRLVVLPSKSELTSLAGLTVESLGEYQVWVTADDTAKETLGFDYCQANVLEPAYDGAGEDEIGLDAATGFFRLGRTGALPIEALTRAGQKLQREGGQLFHAFQALQSLDFPPYAKDDSGAPLDEPAEWAWYASCALLALLDPLTVACRRPAVFGFTWPAEGRLRQDLLDVFEAAFAAEQSSIPDWQYDQARLSTALDQIFVSIFPDPPGPAAWVPYLNLAAELIRADGGAALLPAENKTLGEGSTPFDIFHRLVAGVPRTGDAAAWRDAVTAVTDRLAQAMPREATIEAWLKAALDKGRQTFIDALCSAPPPEPPPADPLTIEAAFKTARAKYLDFLAAGYDAAAVVDQLYARVVHVACDLKKLALDVTDDDADAARNGFNTLLRQRLNDSTFFATRFGLGAAGGPLSGLQAFAGRLPGVALLTRPGAADNLAAIFAEHLKAVAAHIAPDEQQAFVPDTDASPLPIQVFAAPDEDNEAFDLRFNGVAVLMRFKGEDDKHWSHLHLADLYRYDGDELIADDTLHPSRMIAHDGWQEVVLPYHGEGVHTLQGRRRSDVDPDAAVKNRLERSFRVVDPAYHAGLEPPALAYGESYEFAAFAITNNGSLPHLVQSDPAQPWLAKRRNQNTANERIAIADPFKRKVTYQRRAALGASRFARPAGVQGWHVGQMPPGVRPLAFDRHRVSATTFNDAGRVLPRYVDLFRGQGGAGELTGAMQFEITLADAWVWPPTGGRAVTATVCCFDNPAGADCRYPVQTISIVHEQHCRFTLTGLVENKKYWLRLSVDTADHAVSFFTPTERARTQDDTDNFLLLRPTSADWVPTTPTKQTMAVNLPRTNARVFDRWLSNPDLRNRHVGPPDPAAETEALGLMIDAVRLAGSVDALSEAANRVLDRLPDPAIEHLRYQVTPLDSLGADDDGAIPAHVAPRAKVVDLPRLGPLAVDLFEKHTDLRDALLKIRAGDPHINLNPAWLAAWLLDLDLRWTVAPITLTTDGQAGEPFSLTPGTVYAIELLSGVNKALIGSALDKRFEQLAVASAGEWTYFAGDTLNVEVAMTPSQGLPSLVNATTVARGAAHARRYRVLHDATARTANELRKLRHLGSARIMQQHWRDQGRPLWAQLDPREGYKARPDEEREWQALPVRASNRVEFETNAFRSRERDGVFHNAVLLPAPLPSTLLEEHWDSPTATYFRHRITYFSRYRGILVGHDAGIPYVDDLGRGATSPWQSVAIRATPRAALPQPALRSYLPLTRGYAAPEDDEATPGVLALLHEQPYARAGLAERVVADIEQGASYELHANRNRLTTTRAEFGPIPHFSVTATELAVAQSVYIATEEPVGLTFDSIDASSPVFASTALVLRPTSPQSHGGFAHHLLELRLRRYLAPEWVYDIAPPLKTFDTARWFDFELSDGPAEVTIELKLEGKATPPIVTVTRTKDIPSTTVIIGPRYLDERPAEDDGEPLTLCTLEAGVRRIRVLHQPLGTAQAWLGIFAAVVDGTEPVLRRGITWSLPAGMGANPQLVASAKGAEHEELPAYASQPTAPEWARTLQRREVLTGVLGGGAQPRDANDLPCARIVWRGDKSAARGAMQPPPYSAVLEDEPLWPRHPASREPVPMPMQVQTAAVLTELVTQRGRLVEVPHSIQRLLGRGLPAPAPRFDGSQFLVRLLDVGVPALLLCNKTSVELNLPENLKGQGIDVRAMTGIGPPTLTLNKIAFFLSVRVVGPLPVDRAGATTLQLKLGEHIKLSIALTNQGAAASSAAEFHLGSLELTDGYSATGVWIDAQGVSDKLTCTVAVDAAATFEIPDEPLVVRVLGLEGRDEVWFEVGVLCRALESSRTFSITDFDTDWLAPMNDTLGGEPGDGGLDYRALIEPVTMGRRREAQAAFIGLSDAMPLEPAVGQR